MIYLIATLTRSSREWYTPAPCTTLARGQPRQTSLRDMYVACTRSLHLTYAGPAAVRLC